MIEWTHETFNPTSGCTKTESRCCTNCYAETTSETYKNRNWDDWKYGFQFTERPERLDNPRDIPGAKYIFTGSMSDLFHEACDREYIFDVFDVLDEVDQHCYQLLTKRSERLKDLGQYLPWGDHIWAGVSVGTPSDKDKIEDLRECGADVKWISAEPLVDSLGDVDLTGIDWMVIGGESGALNRIEEIELEWVEDLIQQCRDQGTTPFVKQLGEIWAEKNDSEHQHGANIFEWPPNLQVREMPMIYPDQPELDTLPGIEHV
ncbi:phage Gp37/Gp68 family protein [Salinibacter ruber]|uniref:phage Gp37/Gp68 family protein n=1 Tax=Salinibacter ruber TaxID=146919 RepID=UPI0021674A17|nr:phage Gp37/Gp68 family protein [Salinibacter ruber]